MTRRSIYEIRDRILDGRRLVLDANQLSKLALIPRGQAKVYAYRLVKRGFARRVVRGVISFTEDPFVISSQLVEPSYVSFTGALYLGGMIRQIPTIVECVTTRNSLKLGTLGIEYHRIRPSLFFGYERLERYGSYVFVAKPAKAVLDLMYFDLYPEGMELKLDKGELTSAARAYEKMSDYRAGRALSWVKDHA